MRKTAAAGLHFVVAMATAIAFAELFAWLGVPLALIFGSLVGAAIYANVVGAIPQAGNLRRGGQLIVGTAVGALLTQDVLSILGDNILLMTAVAIVANLLALAIAVPVAKLAGTDKLTGVLCCMPAGMAEMSSLAREVGADEQAVAITHSLRVVLIVLSLPLLLGSVRSAPDPGPSLLAVTPTYVVLLVLGGLLALGARRLGALNPWVIAPMGIGLVYAAYVGPMPATPQPLIWGAQIAIGASLGARFDVARLWHLPRAALAGILAAVFLIATMSGLVASIAAAMSGIDGRTMVLAVAPGGLGEMIASAKALGLAASIVAGFQFVRSSITNLFAPALIKRFLT